jgi:ankyrin repeat protein
MTGLLSASRHYRPDLQCIRRDEISERQFVVINQQEVDLMADIIEKGDKEDVQLFIDLYGFFPVDSDGRIPLHYASAYGNLGLVKDLLDRYYEEEVNRTVRMRDCDGKTALFAAAQCGHLEVVEELVLHGADVNCYIYESDGTRTYPHQCAEVYDHWDVVDFLLKNGVKSHDTSLHLATAILTWSDSF